MFNRIEHVEQPKTCDACHKNDNMLYSQFLNTIIGVGKNEDY